LGLFILLFEGFDFRFLLLEVLGDALQLLAKLPLAAGTDPGSGSFGVVLLQAVVDFAELEFLDFEGGIVELREEGADFAVLAAALAESGEVEIFAEEV
jgi:hypothetical protein